LPHNINSLWIHGPSHHRPATHCVAPCTSKPVQQAGGCLGTAQVQLATIAPPEASIHCALYKANTAARSTEPDRATVSRSRGAGANLIAGLRSSTMHDKNSLTGCQPDFCLLAALEFCLACPLSGTRLYPAFMAEGSPSLHNLTTRQVLCSLPPALDQQEILRSSRWRFKETLFYFTSTEMELQNRFYPALCQCSAGRS
jgi:hypothetical protein